MAFIAITDLHTVIVEDELEEITRSDANIVEAAILAAESEARSYLFDNFDVDIIFAKIGTDRHQLLVNICADIALYHIVSRCQAGQELAHRIDRYDRAISWLKQTIKTEVYCDLERRTPSTAQVHIKWGSNPKKNNSY